MTPVGKAWFVNALTFARVPLIFAWLVLAVVQESMPDGAWGLALAVAACAMMLLSAKWARLC